jgi:ATP-dependent DNA helicase RecG
MFSEHELHALIGAGERFEVELKGEERKPLDDRELVETVVCLANGAGGTLLVGVEDDGRITGARPRHGSYTDPNRVQAKVL